VHRSEYIKQLVLTSIEDNYDTHVVYTKRPNFPSIPLGSLGSFITLLKNGIRRLPSIRKSVGRLSVSDLLKLEQEYPATFAMLVSARRMVVLFLFMQHFTHGELRQLPTFDWSAGLYANSSDYKPTRRDDVFSIKALVGV